MRAGQFRLLLADVIEITWDGELKHRRIRENLQSWDLRGVPWRRIREMFWKFSSSS